MMVASLCLCAQDMSSEDFFNMMSKAENGDYVAQFKLGQMYLDGGDYCC